MIANRRVVLPVLLLLAACGDATGPFFEPTLVGRWGSSTALLVGLRVAAELQLGCNSVGTDDPVRMGPDGEFSFVGDYSMSGGTMSRIRARVTGRIENDVVTLRLDILRDGWGSSEYVLRRGVDPGYDTDPPFCPQ